MSNRINPFGSSSESGSLGTGPTKKNKAPEILAFPQDASFKPEWIVNELAAKVGELSSKEKQILTRFLAASAITALFDVVKKQPISIPSQQDGGGIYLAVFSKAEVLTEACIELSRSSAILEPRRLHLRSKVEQVVHSDAGVVLNPFSELELVFPWTHLRQELSKYDRLSSWMAPNLGHREVSPTFWEQELIEKLESWVAKKDGLARIVLAQVGDGGQSRTVVVFIDCVTSELETCKEKLNSFLSSYRKYLPVPRFFMEHCQDQILLERIIRDGGQEISRGN